MVRSKKHGRNENQRGEFAWRGQDPPPYELGSLGRFLLESAKGYALISFDLDGTITSWSSWAESVFGWSKDEAIGRNVSMIFTPGDADRGAVEREIRSVRERGHAEDEKWHIRKDGQRFWGSGVVSGLHDDRGQLVGYAKIVRDLTDERKAEAELRAREERLRLALEAARMGTWDWDIRSGRLTWSETLEQIHGLKPGAFPGTFDGFVATVHPTDRAGVVEAIQQTVRERCRRYEVSYRAVKPDGSMRRVVARGRLLLDPQGEPVRMIGICLDETERKEMEILRGRLAAIVESSQDAIITTDLEGIVESWNRGAERIYGYSAEDVLGRSISILVPPNRHGELADILARLRRGERIEQYDTERVTKDGHQPDISLSISPVHDETGRIVAVATIERDITARKKGEIREQFLAEAGRILASSLDHRTGLRRVVELAVTQIADGCAVYLAEEGRLTTVALQHTDPRKIDIVRELEQRYPPDPEAAVGPYHVLRTGESELISQVPSDLMATLARDDQHRRLLQELELRSMITVPLTASGRTLGVLALALTQPGHRYGHDDLALAESFAERAALSVEKARVYREAEHRAREEEALRRAAEAVAAHYTLQEVLRQIVASALAALDADGAFIERLDASGEQVEVVAVAGVETPPQGTRIARAGSFAARVVESGRAELVSRLADAMDALSPALAAFPDASAVVVPLIDIGVATGALFLLRRSGTGQFRSRDLERAAVYGRLASLAIGKVRLLEESEQRREELRRVMESRARLVRGFSHDVKNPLGAAEGHLGLLEEGLLEPLLPQQAESVRRARASVRSAVELIDQVVDLARIQAGRLKVNIGPVDVRGLVREISAEYRAEAQAIGQSIAVDLPPEISPIQSDSSRIRQILGNVVSNAVRYTPEGGHISLRARRLKTTAESEAPGPGEWLAVYVADTGPGIAKDQHEAIFGEFTRANATHARGAGLGLAISRRLARLLGGDLTVESELGKGSTFTLWLPIGDPPAQPEEPGPSGADRTRRNL